MSLSRAYRDCTDVAKNLDAIFGSTPDRFQLGISEIDAALNGGLLDEFVVVYGKAGRGKTDFLVTALTYLIEKYPVLVASYELGKLQLVRRVLCCLAARRELANSLREDDLYPPRPADKAAAYEKVKEEFDELSKRLIIIDNLLNDDGELNLHPIQELRRAVHELAEQQGRAPILLVDYIQAVPVEGVSLLSTESIDLTSRNLAAIAHTEGAPVIAASSVTKGNEVRGSSHLLHDADIILNIDLGCAQGEENAALAQDERQIRFTVEKNRNGRAGQIVRAHYCPAAHYMY